jgi:hypothetical protein
MVSLQALDPIWVDFPTPAVYTYIARQHNRDAVEGAHAPAKPAPGPAEC